MLDIGCGSGKLGGAVVTTGVRDVCGIDASLYQPKIAARDFPALKLVQGLAETTPFEDGRFDGVAACFLFHELPTDVQEDAVLLEMRRVLRPRAQSWSSSRRRSRRATTASRCGVMAGAASTFAG